MLKMEKYPLYLQTDMEELDKALKENQTYTDCEEDSLASSIKMALIGGEITEQEAKEILKIYPVL